VLTTVLLGWQATKLTLNAAFERRSRTNQPYIKNFLEHRNDLKGLGNGRAVVVENKNGDIFDPALPAGAQADQRRAVPHARRDRANVKSLWMPVVRWNEVTEEGFTGGPVMPDNYTGSPKHSSNCARTSTARRSWAAWSATTSSPA
jgi:predicted RND superfamily exporter protein